MDDLIRRQDALGLVRDVCDAIMSCCGSHYDEETEDEVYDDILEVDAILKCNKEIRIALKNMPSAQPEIILCRDCKYWLPHEQFGYDEDNEEYHDYCAKLVPEDEYYAFRRHADEWCSRAERRTDE